MTFDRALYQWMSWVIHTIEAMQNNEPHNLVKTTLDRSLNDSVYLEQWGLQRQYSLTLSQQRLHSNYEENSREEMTSMANNMHLLYATTCPRGLDVAYGHAMPCAAPEWVICNIRFRMLAHIFGTSGIAVPISRGSPPILTE